MFRDTNRGKIVEESWQTFELRFFALPAQAFLCVRGKPCLQRDASGPCLVCPIVPKTAVIIRHDTRGSRDVFHDFPRSEFKNGILVACIEVCCSSGAKDGYRQQKKRAALRALSKPRSAAQAQLVSSDSVGPCGLALPLLVGY